MGMVKKTHSLLPFKKELSVNCVNSLSPPQCFALKTFGRIESFFIHNSFRNQKYLQTIQLTISFNFSKTMPKTSGYIDRDSPKYVQRTELGMEKKGNQAERTDSAHILGYGVANTILTHQRGPPLGDQGREDFIRSMNSSGKLRIKSDSGNRITDERNDAKISHAIVHKTPITSQAVAHPAVQAYEASKNISVSSVQETLGNMKVLNPETNRTHLLKNHRDFM